MKYVYALFSAVFQGLGIIGHFVFVNIGAGAESHSRWLERKLEEWNDEAGR